MNTLSEYYRKEFNSIKEQFPNLYPKLENGLWELIGVIDVHDENGKYWDSYEVKIRFPPNYPKGTPTMFEIGGKIPPEADYHVNNDGSCCISVPAMEMIILKKGIRILDFIEKLAIPYLANQTFKRLTGKYANGEYGHGFFGTFEFYKSAFKTESMIEIMEGLMCIIKNTLPTRNNPCFCGKNKKYKHCHLETVRYLRPVSNNILIQDFNTFLKVLNYLKEQNKNAS